MSDIVPGAGERLLVMIFSKSIGVITVQTFEEENAIVKKFFPEGDYVFMQCTSPETGDSPVKHYFDIEGKRDIVGIAIGSMKDRKVIPVNAQFRGRVQR